MICWLYWNAWNNCTASRTSWFQISVGATFLYVSIYLTVHLQHALHVIILTFHAVYYGLEILHVIFSSLFLLQKNVHFVDKIVSARCDDNYMLYLFSLMSVKTQQHCDSSQCEMVTYWIKLGTYLYSTYIKLGMYLYSTYYQK